MLAYHFILHTPVAPISTSPLPAALCPLYLYTHFINNYLLTYPTHCLAHEPPPPSLLTDSQHATSKRASLPEGVPFFTSNSSRNQSKKGHYFPFLPLIGVAAMSTSPHNITLCPMLPHHFLLHAKSLPGPTLRAPPKPEVGFRPLPSQVYIHI